MKDSRGMKCIRLWKIPFIGPTLHAHMLESQINRLCTGKLTGFRGKQSVRAALLPCMTCLEAARAQWRVVVAPYRAELFSSKNGT